VEMVLKLNEDIGSKTYKELGATFENMNLESSQIV